MPPAGCERHARAPACLPGTGRVKTVARHFDWCCGQRMMALSRQASRLQPAFMDPRLAEIVDELLQIVQAHPQDLNWQPYYRATREPRRLRDTVASRNHGRRPAGCMLPRPDVHPSRVAKLTDAPLEEGLLRLR